MSQKAENLLNLALDATSEEREKSLELEVGYQPLDQEWDLIIKYSGNLEAVREIASSVTELSNEYAIRLCRNPGSNSLCGFRRSNTLKNQNGCFLKRLTEREHPVFFRYRQLR